MINVNSELNKERKTIQISEVKIKTVTVRGEAHTIPTRIIENGKPTVYTAGEYNPYVIPEIYTRPNSSSDEIDFSFVFTRELTTTLIKPNGRQSIIIGFELEVTYINNNKKRMDYEIQAQETELATFAIEVDVKDPFIETANGVSMIASAILLIIFALLI